MESGFGSDWELEGAPLWHRFLRLDGGLDREAEPYARDTSDLEPERSGVDGLTLQLHLTTTDFYSKQLGSKFALQVRRNYRAEQWSPTRGLAPARRPDRPFGPCWSSGLAASVHVADEGPDLPVRVTVLDELGLRHRFIALHREGKAVAYYPLPGGELEQDARAMRLERQDGHFLFRRKYGTSLRFEGEPAVVISAPGRDGHEEQHRFFRLREVSEPGGGRINAIFEPENRTLIPDRLTGLGGRAIVVKRNEQGQVASVLSPVGVETEYTYHDAAKPGQAPLLERVRCVQAGPCNATYTYALRECGDSRSLVVTSVTDARGETHTYDYAPWAAAGGEPPLHEVHLPGGVTAWFFGYRSRPAAQGTWEQYTFVRNGSGHGLLLHFQQRAAVSLDHLPWRRRPGATGPGGPVILTMSAMEFTAYRGSDHTFNEEKGRVDPAFSTKQLLRERFEFNLGAGLTPARAINAEGKVFTFTHSVPLAMELGGFSPDELRNPLAEWAFEVTESSDPEGGRRRFTFDPIHHRLVRSEDEVGNAKVRELDPATGLPLSESVYAAPVAGNPPALFARTEYVYGDLRFPGFFTRQIIRKVPREVPGPDWEVDLVTDYDADAFGDTTRVIYDPEGVRQIFEKGYDAVGRIISYRFDSGYYEQYAYDARGRIVRVYWTWSRAEKRAYDPRGNLILESFPDGKKIVRVHDSRCRQIEVRETTEEKGKTKTKVWRDAYNAMGTKLCLEGRAAKPLVQTPDGLERIIKAQRGLSCTRYQYDVNGCSLLFTSSRLEASVEQGDKATFRLKYDSRQRLLTRKRGPILPLAVVTNRRKYDLAGNLVEEWGPAGGPMGQGQRTCIYRHYDALNRLVREVHTGGYWKRYNFTSTGLDYGWEDSRGKGEKKVYDSTGDVVT